MSSLLLIQADCRCCRPFSTGLLRALLPCSNLMVELWDLEEVALSASKAFTSSPRAQPFLVAARGSTPLGYYNASSSTWTFLPAGSLTDVEGQDLMRPYLEVRTLESQSIWSSQLQRAAQPGSSQLQSATL